MVETADILLSPLKGRMCCGKKGSTGPRMSVLNENRKFEHPTDSILLLSTGESIQNRLCTFSFTIIIII